MDVRTMLPPAYASPAAAPMMGTPPAIGTPIPGTTGGLPALGGLSVNNNPMAQRLQSAGRGEDSMLVHMTPGEVNSLQGLAMANGGSLTINPETGLPEAGFLSKILPMVLGAGLSFIPGVGPLMAAGLVGLGTGAATGDINKGLMAGLGAFGGASLAASLGAGAVSAAAPGAGAGVAGEQVAANLVPEVASNVAPEIATSLAEQAATTAPAGVGTVGVEQAARYTPNTFTNAVAPGFEAAAGQAPFDLLSQVPGGMAGVGQGAAPTAAPGFFSRFGEAARQGLPETGILKSARTYAPYVAGLGVASPFLTPSAGEFPEEEEIDYTVPRYRTRNVMPRIPEGDAYARDGYQGEIQFFDPAGPRRMAEGDEVPQPRDEVAPTGGLGGPGASLPDYIKMFQTSPGAITGVPYGYGPGQSPMDLIRADIAAKAAAAAAAAPTPAATPGAPGAAIAPPSIRNPIMGGEADYGFMKSSPARTPSSYYDDSYGYFGDQYGGYPAGRFNFSPMMGGYAGGGRVEMESGGFVMPARETAEFGNGSTDAGQQRLATMGGMPINGRGDGVSDSIVARIDGTQQARLANGETYFPPRAVERMGGADKLRAMMHKATKSRQKAARGGQNKLRGLA